MDCFFCEEGRRGMYVEGELTFVRKSDFPVTPGHSEFVPKRHAASFFELTEEEGMELRRLLADAKRVLDAEHHPDGYNIGVNEGEAAGRIVPHVHVHLIPRSFGDAESPRGGVRHIIPQKGAYADAAQVEARTTCLLCELDGGELLAAVGGNEHWNAIPDKNPVSPGHLILVPKRHVESFFDLGAEQFASLLSMLREAKLATDALHHPAGYNIGVNDGVAAGRTVPHVHVHLIPRYAGDVEHPRGGVRNIIPGKGAYPVPPRYEPEA